MNYGQQPNNAFAKLTEGIGAAGSDALDSINNNFNAFSNNTYVSGTKDFLNSNSMIAKLAFLVLVVILFVLIMRVGIQLLSWWFSPDETPYLVKGMKPGKQHQVIAQNPNYNSAIPLVRSDNQDEGLEFTYSTWLYIEDMTYGEDRYRHIFSKGNDYIESQGSYAGMVYPNNAPGLYIAPSNNGDNNLVVVMNTFNKVNEELLIRDVPIKKWINVIIRVEGNVLDVYINGNIIGRKHLSGVPKQNYSDVNIGLNGGFDGYMSDLRYWNYGLSIGKIDKIIKKGPNLKMKDDMKQSFPNYLSLRWFMNN